MNWESADRRRCEGARGRLRRRGEESLQWAKKFPVGSAEGGGDISFPKRPLLTCVVRLSLMGALIALAAGSGCGPRPAPRAPAIGEAYVAPETLKIRRDIPLNSGVEATLKRGEHVEVIQRRRRFVKIRSASNQEGWTEQGQLLTPEVYNQIRDLGRKSAASPSLGVYRARDKLNIHIEPYRSSPSFYQLKENEKVDVLARRVSDRTASQAGASTGAAAAEPVPSVPVRQAAEQVASQAVASGAPNVGPPAEKPKQYDAWYFVRATDPQGEPRAGWALARALDAAIPDEVAQYAEGHQITSYSALGEVTDGDETKKIWLWTTLPKGTEPYDFDSFRVFNWGRRRHHYETAYIERRLTGFYPITVTPSVKTKYGTGPAFSLVIEKDDGKRYVRHYVMIGAIVRLYAQELAGTPAPLPSVSPGAEPAPGAERPEAPSLWQRIRARFRRAS